MGEHLVVVGTSLGGLYALRTLLPGLPASFPAPVVIVQHRGVENGDRLRQILQKSCVLKVVEPQDKEPLAAGRVYLAPPDYHLLVEEAALALTTSELVCSARPSIDVLFETAAESYRERAIGVVLTGASADGSRGAALIKAYGGRVIVQDPVSAECAIMPAAALNAVRADRVLPIEEIAACLVSLVTAGEDPATHRPGAPDHR